MTILQFSDSILTVDEKRGCVTSLTAGSQKLLEEESALFRFCLRSPDGTTFTAASTDGRLCAQARKADTVSLSYTDFSVKNITVTVSLTVTDGALNVRVSAQNATKSMLEWIDVLPLVLPALQGEGGPLNGEILYPYNEGAIVDSVQKRQNSRFPSSEPQYPSMGRYPVFPNMICSQMMAYLYQNNGYRRALYFGAHDPRRGVKAIDFFPSGNGVEMLFRYYCGVGFGEDYEADFPLVLRLWEGKPRTEALTPMMSAPASARPIAMPLPIPRRQPVTSAIFPSSLN